MELAGQGALLKMLEERRKKLAAEGLFDGARKRALPFLPQVIGVVTSPSGAVIRDILHRLADRFPRHVLLWPVAVQGEDAAAQVAAAVFGFDAIAPGGPVPRPDLLIVARGGGSLEDLMPFNDEAVVRAVAACSIPVISAIGHETDTTLIDHAADRRAPTPTAAAEMAVPVRLELLARVGEQGQRLFAAALRRGEEKKARLETLAARLGDPERLLELRRQRADHLGRALAAAFEKNLAAARAASAQAGARLRDPQWLLHKKEGELAFHAHRLKQGGARLRGDRAARLDSLAGRLRAPQALVRQGRERVGDCFRALARAGERIVAPREAKVSAAAGLLNALSYHKVLERGFAVVTGPGGHVVSDAAALAPGDAVEIRLHKGRAAATVSGTSAGE
jgi:exodeoxyribonuclease VII large subunit